MRTKAGRSVFEDDWFDAEEFQKEITADSQKRRANPVEFLATFLRDIWTDNTDEEARLVWRSKAKLAPWYAEDALYCLNAVIAHPPANLAEIVQNRGNLYLYHQDGSAKPYTDIETLAWLKQTAAEFQAIYEAVQADKDTQGA